MALMQEHEDNRFTKEKTDIERYLLRIIQRYFEIENINSQISVENIIVESIRRLKYEIFDERGFIFSFNNQTGHITLNIQFFGGEYVFEKNTAFNKDFGKDQDAICEGNDKRLSNKRTPLDHIHDIGDVADLKERLAEFLVQLQEVHYHNNLNALDLLSYAGLQAEIDLIVIDDLLDKVDTYYTSLEQVNLELRAQHNNNMDTLGRALIATKKSLTSIKDFINQSFVWTVATRQYIKNNILLYTQNIVDSLAPFLTKDAVNDLTEYMKKFYTMVNSGDVPIVGFYTTFDQNNNNTTTMVQTDIVQYPVSDKAKLYFKYRGSQGMCMMPLPYICKIPGGFCYIQGGQDGGNNIYVEVKLITTLEGLIDSRYTYDGNVIIPSIESGYYNDMKNIIDSKGMRLCIVDSLKQPFIQSLITDNKLYFINAFKDPIDDTWFAIGPNGEEIRLPYTASTFQETNGNHVCIDHNGVLHRVDGITTRAGYIAEYTIPDFNNYFYAPSIHYQIYKEGV